MTKGLSASLQKDSENIRPNRPPAMTDSRSEIRVVFQAEGWVPDAVKGWFAVLWVGIQAPLLGAENRVVLGVDGTLAPLLGAENQVIVGVG